MDFLQGVISEIDRSQLPTPRSMSSDLIKRVLSRLSLAQSARPSLAAVRFFDCVRNCIVHQMGRANSELVMLRDFKELHDDAHEIAPLLKSIDRWEPVKAVFQQNYPNHLLT